MTDESSEEASFPNVATEVAALEVASSVEFSRQDSQEKNKNPRKFATQNNQKSHSSALKVETNQVSLIAR